MGRPPRARAVECLPRAAFFKPAGVPARDLKHVLLKVDELEALRLADLLGLSQEQAAARLGVSRQTVGRVLEAAHGKVADALVNGKALEIDGGVYRLVQSRCCQDCGHRWVSLRTTGQADPAATAELKQDGSQDGGSHGAASEGVCPDCGSLAVVSCPPPACGRGGSGHRRGRGMGRGRGRGCADPAESGREPGRCGHTDAPGMRGPEGPPGHRRREDEPASGSDF